MLTRAQKLRNTFGYYALFVCLGLGLAVLGPTLTLLACQTGATTDAMGSIFLASSIGVIAGTLLGGRLFDRVRRGNALLGGGQLLWAGLVAAIPLTRSLWPLLVLCVCRGVLEGFINTGGNTLLLWTHREKASPFINGLHFSFGVGAVIAPLLVAAFLGPERGLGPDQVCAAVARAPAAGYPWAYWTIAVFGLAASLWVLTMADSPDPAAQGAEAQGARATPATPWLLIVVAAVYLFAYVSGEISFGSWIATYAAELGIADTRGAAVLTSVFWLAFTIGRLVSIPVALWFTPRQVIPVGIAACLVVAALLVAMPPSGAGLWAAAAGLGFCMAPLWPSGYTLAGTVISLTGFTSSMVLLGDGLGGMVLPSLTGWIMGLFQRGGPRWLAASLPLLVLASLLVCLAAYVALLRAGRGRAGSGAP